MLVKLTTGRKEVWIDGEYSIYVIYYSNDSLKHWIHVCRSEKWIRSFQLKLLGMIQTKTINQASLRESLKM
jgi:hypothetical protein